MFGGGSGSRDITMALCRGNYDVTRVVPAWDSGGSSRALRDSLGILAMGDIRQALMTMAHGEDRVSHVVRFFNARLSEASNSSDLLAEFDFYASGAHPLLGMMEPGIRGAILNYLRVFQSKIGDGFDFCRGSIGNFVLTGAHFAHGGDINTAIFVFRKLCAIEGNVWPSTTDNGAALSAELRDGRIVLGQDRVTSLTTEHACIGIDKVSVVGSSGMGRPSANPAVLEAIGEADALLFGPGSFFTSTVAHLSVEGICPAIEATGPEVPKILTGNILECPETTGRSLSELVQAFDLAGRPGLLTHVLVNRGWVPFERVMNGHRYLHAGSAEAAQTAKPVFIADDFEDPWSRGRHDASKVAATVGTLIDETRASIK